MKKAVIAVYLGLIGTAIVVALWGYGKQEVVERDADNVITAHEEEQEEEPVITLMATGDVMLGRFVNYQAVEREDMLWPWRNVKDTLTSADILFVNLESPLTDPCPLTQAGMVFCGSLRHAQAMREAGVHVAGVANNHGEDRGVDGLEQTVEVLEREGIASVGAGRTPAFIEVDGMTFAFLAYNDVGPSDQHLVAQAKKEHVAEDIQAAREEADVVVVMYHWGNEYTHEPTERQRVLARFTVDAGADLVLGNHPHWVQPQERYNGGVIMYSHGNFIFDQNWSRKTSEGVIGVYTFQGSELIDTDFISVIIEDNAQPRLASEEEHEHIMQFVE